jgi:periplasmic copper chaperone A
MSIGAAAALVGLSAVPAVAHVTVSSPDATQGGFGVITFRVPTESDTASTTGLKVQFPADQPLAFASVKPKAGWTYEVTKAKLPAPVKTGDGEVTEYTSVIEWKASTPAAGIKPGEFEEFQVSGGPLPEAESMTFKAIQTYSDDKVVSWIEEPPAGSNQEPDFPAPTLKLASAAAPRDGVTASTTPIAPASADAASKGSVAGAYLLGGLGLVAGLAGLALGLAARRRRPGTLTPDGEPAEVTAGS